MKLINVNQASIENINGICNNKHCKHTITQDNFRKFHHIEITHQGYENEFDGETHTFNLCQEHLIEFFTYSESNLYQHVIADYKLEQAVAYNEINPHEDLLKKEKERLDPKFTNNLKEIFDDIQKDIS